MKYEFATLSPSPPDGLVFKNHTVATHRIINKHLHDAVAELSAEGWLVVHFNDRYADFVLLTVWFQREDKFADSRHFRNE